MQKQSPLIVVTGGTGYLGSVLVPLLRKEGYRVRIINRHTDVRSYPKEILSGAAAVIDLAAIANDQLCELHPRLTYDINVSARFRTATLAKRMGVKCYILASSCSVYGRQSGIITESTKSAPVTTYARSCLAAEKAVLALASADFSVTVFRLSSLFGLSPRMRFDILLNTMVLSLFQTGTITILDGKQWRPILHVSDAANAFLLALQTPADKINGQIFNVGSSSQNIQILPLAKLLIRALSLPQTIIMNTRTSDSRSYRVSARKIKKILHFTAHKTPEDAAHEIYESLTRTNGPTITRQTRYCLICGNTKMTQYISLGTLPLANSYVSATHLSRPHPAYPLAVAYCHTCHLSQLPFVVSPKKLFKDYAYFSSASPQLAPYFKDYARELWEKFPTQAKHILEIGSNDGALLTFLQKRGSTVLGIDPAKNIAKVAESAGIPTIDKFFTLRLARQLKKDYPTIGMIIANHVVAHTGDPHDMIAGVKHMLGRSGVFVCEVKYLADLIAKNEFDTIYHEHVSYFLLKPLITLLEMHDLDVFDVTHQTREGGSMRIFASHRPLRFPLKSSVGTVLKKEKELNLYTFRKYTDFAKKPLRTKKELITMLRTLKKSGKRIAGYGASAKGGTLLQYCGISEKYLDFVADESSSKAGKYMPGNHIPIVSPAMLKTHTPDYILLLAWNYADSIMNRERWFAAQGGKFIIPIPFPRVVEKAEYF